MPQILCQTLQKIQVYLKRNTKIYNKGIGAYKTNPSSVRPNVKSKEQWAQARVYSAVMGGKASKVDKKNYLWKKVELWIQEEIKIKNLIEHKKENI